MDSHQQDTVTMVYEAAQGVTAKFDRSYYLQRAADGASTRDMWQAIADQGLLALGVPEEFGGPGTGLTAPVALMEAMGRAGTPQTLFATTNFVRQAIIEHGSADQRHRFVPGTVTGEMRYAFALTEPDSGTNSFNIRTTAIPDRSGYRLTGQKTFISYVDEAEAMMVVARVAGEEQSELSLFMVDLPADGVVANKMQIHLNAPSRHFTLFLDDVKVAKSDRVGAEGDAKRVLFSALNPERFMIAGMVIGLGMRAIDMGAGYARHRSPFGRPIGSYQAVQHPLAKARAELEAARLMTYEGCKRHEEGNHDIGFLANAAMYLASNAADAAVDAAIQAYGGSAFDAEADVAALWPMIRLQRIAPINNEMALNYIAQRELDPPKS